MAKVIVIGRNYTSRLGMIRALGKAGYEIAVIRTNKGKAIDIDFYSKYVKEYHQADEPNRTLLIETLNSIATKNEKSILIPVDDYAASTIDENINVLKEHFLFPNVNMEEGAVNRLMNKEVQKKLAREAGLPVAEGWVVNKKNGKYEIPKDIKYPCFPKPQISFLGNKNCMKKCSSRVELEEVLYIVANNSNCPILIEQYIPIDKEYGVLGFCKKGESTLPGLVDKVMIGNGAHKGVTKVGIVTPLAECAQLYDLISRFLKSTGFTGLCDIDLYESNGIIYFNELNLRFGAFGYSIYCSGINLPEMFVRYLQGDNIPVGSIYSKTTCLSEKVNFEDLIAGYYDLDEYERIEKIADKTFLADVEDPQPYINYKKAYVNKILLRKKIKRFLYKVIKWKK